MREEGSKLVQLKPGGARCQAGKSLNRKGSYSSTFIVRAANRGINRLHRIAKTCPSVVENICSTASTQALSIDSHFTWEARHHDQDHPKLGVMSTK